MSTGEPTPSVPSPAASDRSAGAGRWSRDGVLALAVGLVTLALMVVRLRVTPDILGDEVLYTRAAQGVLEDGSLSWFGEPIFVHPPLFMLVLAGWLQLGGAGSAGVIDAIVVARHLTALAAAAYVAGMWLLVVRVLPGPTIRRRVVATAAAVVCAVDPLILRYGRLAMIDSMAMAATVFALLSAWRLRDRPAGVAVPVLGLVFGLAILTKELTVFVLVAPLLWAARDRCRPRMRVYGGALVVALGLWTSTVLWAASLGQLGAFADEKDQTLRRLLGLLQVTGYNREGVSLVDGFTEAAGTYLSSYVVLVLGGVAVAWRVVRPRSAGESYVAVAGFCAYAFSAFTVVRGQFNEQFLIYSLPFGAAALASMAGELLDRPAGSRRRHALALSAAVWLILAGVFGGATWWRLQATGDDRALQEVAAAVEARTPSCAVVNGTGSVETMEGLMPRRRFVFVDNGRQGVDLGVRWYLVSEKDARNRYGNMSPALAEWVRRTGEAIVSLPSATYDQYELYLVEPSVFDPTAGVSTTDDGGSFVLTEGAGCGGFAVVDAPNSALATGYRAYGGKADVGRPLSTGWTVAAGTRQAFDTIVLEAGPGGVLPAPAFAELARDAPDVLAAHGVPLDGGRQRSAAIDRPIAAARADAPWLGAALSDAERVDGMVRQTFERGVLERPVTSTTVRLAPVGAVFADGGLVPAAAQTRLPSPFGAESVRAEAPVGGFAAAAGVMIAACVIAALVGRRAAHARAGAVRPPLGASGPGG